MYLFEVNAFGFVRQKRKNFMYESTISILKPKLHLKVKLAEGFAKVNVSFELSTFIENPYSKISLTNCRLIAQTDILNANLNFTIKNIQPGKTFWFGWKSKPVDWGQNKLMVVQLNCKELYDVRASTIYEVRP